MATYAASANLDGISASTITLAPSRTWAIVNPSATTTVYARFDGSAATAAGDNCVAILPASSRRFLLQSAASSVSLFAGAAITAVTAEGY